MAKKNDKTYDPHDYERKSPFEADVLWRLNALELSTFNHKNVRRIWKVDDLEKLLATVEERVAHLEGMSHSLEQSQVDDRPVSMLPPVPPATPYHRLEEAISEWAGPRCPDYEEGCATCDTWKQFDDLVAKAESCGNCFGVMTHSPEIASTTPANSGPGTVGPEKKYDFHIERAEEIDGEVVPWMTRTDWDSGNFTKPYSERGYEMNHANTYKLLKIAEAQILHLHKSGIGQLQFHHARYDELEAINNGLKKDLAGLRSDRDRILKGYEDLLVQHEVVRTELDRAEKKLIVRS